MGILNGAAGYKPFDAQNDPNLLEMREAFKSGKTISELRDFKSQSSQSSPLVVDTGDKEIDDMMNRLSGLPADTQDYLISYFLNEKSNENAWNRSMYASDTQYQRAVKDLQKAGLNPYMAFQSLNGSAPTSAGQSVSGGHKTSSKNNELTQGVNAGTRVLAILAALFASMAKVAGSSGGPQ